MVLLLYQFMGNRHARLPSENTSVGTFIEFRVEPFRELINKEENTIIYKLPTEAVSGKYA